MICNPSEIMLEPSCNKEVKNIQVLLTHSIIFGHDIDLRRNERATSYSQNCSMDVIVAKCDRAAHLDSVNFLIKHKLKSRKLKDDKRMRSWLRVTDLAIGLPVFVNENPLLIAMHTKRHAHDNNILIEVWIAWLRMMDLNGVAPDLNGANWQPSIYAAHFRNVACSYMSYHTSVA